MSYAKLDMSDRINEETSDGNNRDGLDGDAINNENVHNNNINAEGGGRRKKISVISTDSEFDSAIVNTDMTTASGSRPGSYGEKLHWVIPQCLF